jgi:hypothetical protein
MSGPKVVRVVTREELVAAGTALLARVDMALAQWKRECCSLATPVDVEVMEERRKELAAMLAADKFSEFGKAAVDEVDYLEADAGKRRERAVRARAQERLRQASGQELARALLRDGSNLEPQVRAELEKGAAGQLSVAALDVALSRARQMLFQVTPQAATQAQMALAERLGSAEAGSSFESWRAKAINLDMRLESAFTHLGELEALGFDAEAEALGVQIRSAQSLDDDATRDMRLDTLFLALRSSKDVALATAKLLRLVELLSAELFAVSGESDIVRNLRSANVHLGQEKLQALLTSGRDELTKVQAAAAAVARRKAILDGLQKLGYQVQVGLSTMTADSGRLVVRRPSDSAYGVELVTGANQKIQVRSVAFDAGRNPGSDIAEERRWCGDFSKLQTDLQESGCKVVVERALGVGAAALRVVEGEQGRNGDRTVQRPGSVR